MAILRNIFLGAMLIVITLVFAFVIYLAYIKYTMRTVVDNFDKIKYRMTIADVKELIGEPLKTQALPGNRHQYYYGSRPGQSEGYVVVTDTNQLVIDWFYR